MKTTTWNREAGYVSVVLFKNGTSAAVSTKTYATKKGAESANTRLQDMCGENWELGNLPYRTTNPDTGEQTVNYRTENLQVIK
jgi:hypothetical protein|tara:strand:+ start:608 stop:856 length:249 start_codon:yes stop_codon:yes gene_type:complete